MKLPLRTALFILFSLLLFFLSRGTIQKLIALSLDLDNKEASHILVIPFVSATLIWFNAKNIFRDVRWSVLPGILVSTLGGVLLAAGRTTAVRINENDHLALLTVSLIALWFGVFLLFYGSAAFRSALFPLLFLFLAVPIPDGLLNRIIGVLQSASAEVAYVLIKFSGTPVYREGLVFTLPDLAVEVAPECSGIRSGIALFIAGLLAGHLFLRSLWKKGVLLSAAIPILLFKNGLRIAVLTLLAVHYDKRILTSQLHQEGGIPFFVLGLCLIYPVLRMLVKSERNKSKAISDAPSLSAQYGDFQ